MPSKVYIAGVGATHPSQKSQNANFDTMCLVSAATKALLDSGISFNDVSHGVRGRDSKHISDMFRTFRGEDIEIDEVKDGSELERAYQLVNDQNTQCVLAVAEAESAAIALILASERFLWRHPYLKDSSILLREQSNSKSSPRRREGDNLQSLCQMVWTLRGWTKQDNDSKEQEKLSFQGFHLSRADGQGIPKWEEVEHKQDGKFRLGHNPATGTQEISWADFEVVRGDSGQQREGLKEGRFKRKGGDRAALEAKL